MLHVVIPLLAPRFLSFSTVNFRIKTEKNTKIGIRSFRNPAPITKNGHRVSKWPYTYFGIFLAQFSEQKHEVREIGNGFQAKISDVKWKKHNNVKPWKCLRVRVFCFFWRSQISIVIWASKFHCLTAYVVLIETNPPPPSDFLCGYTCKSPAVLWKSSTTRRKSNSEMYHI